MTAFRNQKFMCNKMQYQMPSTLGEALEHMSTYINRFSFQRAIQHQSRVKRMFDMFQKQADLIDLHSQVNFVHNSKKSSKFKQLVTRKKNNTCVNMTAHTVRPFFQLHKYFAQFQSFPIAHLPNSNSSIVRIQLPLKSAGK